MKDWIDISPDIEVEADEWEDQQKVMRDLAMEDLEDPFENYLYTGINSCDALRIIDGVVPDRWKEGA